MTGALFFSAFLMGLLGSPHCLGMCGGIVSAFGISMQGLSKSKRQGLIAIYHIGRLLSYMLLGALAALVGATLFTPFYHSSLPKLLLGLSLVLVAFMMLGLPLLNRIERLGFGLWQALSPVRAKLFPLTTPTKALAAGMLWGFLPCGLVYGAILMASSSAALGNDLQTKLSFGALIMLSFGLGTLPMLIATQQVVAWLQQHIKRFSLRQASASVMLLSGLVIAAMPLLHSHHSSATHNDHQHADHAPAHHAQPSSSSQTDNHTNQAQTPDHHAHHTH